MTDTLKEPFFGDAEKPYQQGDIVAMHQLTPEESRLDPENTPRAVWSVEVSDPYVDRYSREDQKRILEEETAANHAASLRRMNGLWERKPGTAYFDAEGNPADKGRIWGDPVSTAKFFNAHGLALHVWQKMIPAPEALLYISDPVSFPTVQTRPLKDGLPITVPTDHLIGIWHALCTDGRAIRSRATIMSKLGRDFVESTQEAASLGIGEGLPDEIHWFSAGCGTTLPTVQGAIASGIQERLTIHLADKDTYSMLSTAEVVRKQLGFSGKVRTNEVDIFNLNELKALKAKMDEEGTRPMIVDAMGVFEYTGSRLTVDSSEFLAALYDILAPGGRLLIGQMRSDRPNPDFTLGVVAWPYIELRNPNEFMAVVRDAGIPPDRAELFLPTDGVNSILAIDKPRAHEINLAASSYVLQLPHALFDNMI